MKEDKTNNKAKHGYIMQRFLLAIVILLFFGAGESHATKNPVQQKDSSEQEKSQNLKDQQQLDKSKISKDAVKVFVKQVQIYGTVAKPQAIFFYKSGDPKVDGLQINRHFFDHIFRNVEKSSIKRVRKKQAIKKDHIEW